MGNLIEQTQCPRCAEEGRDNSADNLSVYDDGMYCYACGYSTRPDGSESDDKFIKGEVVSLPDRALEQPSLAKYNVQCMKFTGHINPKSYVYEEDCVVFNFYENGKIVKQKLRALDDRSKCTQIGKTKSKSLFGMHAFTPSKKIPIVVTEGEFDAVAVHQAMNYPAVAICGAGNSAKHLAENIEWLSQWAHVVLCFDSDEAGKEATDTAIGLFEIGKVRVAHLPMKDPNDMIKAHREEELKRAIWNAEVLKPSTIVTVDEITERVLVKPTFGDPWPYEHMNKVTRGLMPGSMYVVAAAEGQGKTEFVKELLFSLIDNKTKCGLFSFEQDAASTVQRFIGSKLNKRLHLPEEKWWDEEIILEEMDKIKDSLYLYDNKGSLGIDSICLNIRYLVKCMGVKFVVIDNLTALCANCLIDGKTVNDITYMAYAANKFHSLIKELGISMLILAHLNNDTISKSTYVSTSAGTKDDYMSLNTDEVNDKVNQPGLTWESGRCPTLVNIYGSGAIRKLADYIMVLYRNKVSDDFDERRTTKVKFLKSRLDSSLEGSVFKLIYNYDTGRLDESADTSYSLSTNSI